MLEVEGLLKLFGDRRAVDGATFNLRPGEIIGLLGENGAGKTTTLRCIAGVLQPTGGRIRVHGQDFQHAALSARRRLAYVPEVPHPYELLSIWEHLLFIAAAYGRSLDTDRAEDLLKRFDLQEQRDLPAARLSKGMRQKLACAAALAHQPDFYLFDEPLIGLDPQGARQLRIMIDEERRRGAGVLISTHMLAVAEEICDRIIVMHRGRIAAQGPLTALRLAAGCPPDAPLEEVYLRLSDPAHG